MAGDRFVVVGAGPAGVRAAETLVAAGVRPVLIDEAAAGGGQIYRRQPEGFRRDAKTLYGSEAGRAEAIHRTFEGLRDRIDYMPGALAWSVSAGLLHVLHGNVSREIGFDVLVIASGATDRIFPVPGWTRPGVFTLGGAQIALKAQACAIGHDVVFMGTGPLLYVVAHEYMTAGAKPVAVLDTSSPRQRLAGAAGMATRPRTLLKGLGLMQALRRGGVVLHSGVTPLEIAGDGEGVTALRFREASGAAREIACDAVGLGYHLRAETQLADLAGVRFVFDETMRQWLPEHDGHGRTSVEGVYLAGDGAQLAGADGAEAMGQLAALAALADRGHDVDAAARDRARRENGRMLRFRDGLAASFAWPGARFAPELPDETIVCRCEAVTAGAIRSAAGEKGASEMNRAKALSRVGMGRCQGRYCGLAAAEILAATLGVPVSAVGRLRGQAPVRPIPAGVRTGA